MGFDVAVIGGGIGGVCAVGKILDVCPSAKIAWVDKDGFCGGDLQLYDDVPSNTMVCRFLGMVEASAALTAADEKVGATANLRKLFKPEETCPLYFARELATSLARALPLIDGAKITQIVGSADQVTFFEEKGVWEFPVLLSPKTSSNENTLCSSPRAFTTASTAKVLVLATGAEPRTYTPPTTATKLIPLIDTLALPTTAAFTRQKLSVERVERVCVLGSSHSSVLAMRHFTALGVPVLNVYRHDCKYSQLLPDGRYLHDNTGLKGEAAQWARIHLDGPSTPAIRRVMRRVKVRQPAGPDTDQNLDAANVSDVDAVPQEKADEEIRNCDYVVAAIGFEPRKTVAIHRSTAGVKPAEIQVEFNGETGRFNLATWKDTIIPKLYGIGIGFPRTVVDASGEVEAAVGFAKFIVAAAQLADMVCKDLQH